jgi:putative ABC transport system permease protein
LLGPVVIGWPTALVGRSLLPGGGTGFLAGSALGTGRFRAGAVGAAIALVVALAGTQVVGIATGARAIERASARRVHSDHVLVARGGDGLPPSVARDAARLPGARAAGVVSTEVYLLDHGLTNDGDSWTAAGLAPAATRGLLDLDVRAGSLAAVSGNGIAVSDTLADDGARLGRVVHARLADATPVDLRVVAVYHSAGGLGDVVLPRRLALAHATAALDSAVFVRGGNEPRVARRLDALTRAVPTAVVQTRADYLGSVKLHNEDNARAQRVVDALMILIVVMAAFNTGAMAAAERRRELVLARLSGATRLQIVGALTLESVVTTLVGILVGAGVTLISFAGLGSDPHAGPLVVPWGEAALVLAGGAALGLLGTLVPAALAGRARLTALAGLRE